MTELIHGGGILGEKVTEARRVLDTFDLPESVYDVRYVTDEVTSNCPITGQPDWYRVEILVQGRLGLESKSLKLYLQSFRDDGQFCEAFADTIARDVVRATGGHASVTVKQRPRGGVAIEAYAEIKADD